MKKTKHPGKYNSARFAGTAAVALLFAAGMFISYGAARSQALPTDKDRDTGTVIDASAARQFFSIPPQPLASALDRFGEATGIHIFYNSRLTKDAMSPGVTGFLTPDIALRMLLVGTPVAPVVTGPKAITLGLNPEITAYANSGPPPAPDLSLHTMQVEASPATDLRLYAATVRYVILHALQRDPTLSNRHYSAVVDVWVSSTGSIRQSELPASSGVTDIDMAIDRVVHSLTIGLSPPLDMPQPMHIKLQPQTSQ